MTLLACFSSSVALAQSKDSQPTDGHPDVVVHGRTFDEAQKLVETLAPSPNGLQLARWHGAICPQVIGLSAGQTTYLKRRISEEARRLDVDVAPDRCHGNVMIVFTDQADALIADTVKHYPGIIQDVDLFGLPHAKERAPYLVSRPVRWFLVSRTGTADGDFATTPSRITKTTRQNSVLSWVIVDDHAVDGVKWSQLADYLTMVTLGRPAIDANYSNTDSILALFVDHDAGQSAPPGMTDQDHTFLHALYNSNASLSPDEQRNQIARALMKTVKPDHDAGG
jgi:hypothetical protein